MLAVIGLDAPRPEALLLTVVVAVLVAAGMTAALTPAVIALAMRAGAIAQPTERGVHTKPTPTWGGLAVVAGVAAAVLAVAGTLPATTRSVVYAILGGGVLIAIVGAVDDRFKLRPLAKLAGQVGVAMLLPLWGVRIDAVTNPFPAGHPLLNSLTPLGVTYNPDFIFLGAGVSAAVTVFWVVLVMNAMNLLDGLDGLAAGAGAIFASGFVYLALSRSGAGAAAVLSGALAGACVGFLPYNFSPARVFMGDLGSMFLGYWIATSSILGGFKTATAFALVVPFIVLLLPLLDATFAVVRRLIRRRPIFSADRGHVHHRLLGLGWSQRGTVLFLYLVCGVCTVLAALVARLG